VGKGYLKIKTVTESEAIPVGNASITVLDKDNKVIYKGKTNEAGDAYIVELEAPDKWHMEDPYAPGPRHSDYKVLVGAPGFITMSYDGVMIFDTSTSILKVELEPVVIGQEDEIKHINIGGVKLDDPGEIQQAEFEEPPELGSMTRFLPEVTIPNYVRVHLGRMERPAQVVNIPFIEYIKNVTSHEIFDEWPEEALIANVYCIISLTLNRIFTEFYRKRGFNFDITSETFMDQKFVYRGVIGERISEIVDRIFNNYLAIVGHKEPFLSLYNDGIRVNMPGRLSQWVSFFDARDRGMNAWQIIEKYYSQNLELRVCDNFGGILESFPGYTLSQGSRGDVVRTMQLYLNRILGRYSDVIINPVDGIYGPMTRNSVLMFQRIYGLPQTGTIDRRTWYEISRIYGIERALWEMDSEGKRIGIGKTPPTRVIRQGESGPLVVELQFLLDYIAMFHREIPFVAQTSRFDSLTEEGVRAFQSLFNLTADGVVGPATWRRLYEVYWGIKQNTTPPLPPPSNPVPPGNMPPFPGTSLRVGSQGADVRIVQQAINKLADAQPGMWRIGEDGIFGNGTRDAVMAFQRIFGLTVDGIVGPNTWRRLMEEAHMTTTPSTQTPPFPGTNIGVGSTGTNVRLIQQAINKIAPNYPGRLWTLSDDGIFGNMTRDAIFAFQSIFGLPITGVVNQATWDRLMQEASGISQEQQVPPFPGTNIGVGFTGTNVRLIQQAINAIAPNYPGRLWILAEDGVYGNMVRDAIFAFQSIFGLPVTGVVGQATWDRLMQEVAHSGRSSAVAVQGASIVNNQNLLDKPMGFFFFLLLLRGLCR